MRATLKIALITLIIVPALPTSVATNDGNSESGRINHIIITIIFFIAIINFFIKSCP